MSVIIFIIVLAVLILSHEFGHFIVAKKCGVRVDEFGLGFPPRVFGFKRGETTYSLNWLPFGGFVKIFGENPDEEALTGFDASRSLINRPRYQQALVLVAGVVCNLILAWLFLSIGLMSGLPVASSEAPAGLTGESRLLITTVKTDSPAEKSGLKLGDEIVSLTDSLQKQPEQLEPKTVADFMAAHPAQNLDLVIKRAGTEQKITVQPQIDPTNSESRAIIGIGLEEVITSKLGLFPAFARGAVLTSDITIATVVGLFDLIKQAFAGQPVLENITGPVGLAGLVGDAASLGWVYLLSFTAFISINLAVLNLLPFPALDGGRLLFLLIEKIKGSAIKPQVANTLNLVGFGLLLLLMAVVTYGDIARLLLK
ncbi:MAG: RIP metalloprotease RseP [Patescibacteria group bacterium]